MNSATQVRTAASPTRLWKAATSWGKSEISIRLAMVRPAAQWASERESESAEEYKVAKRASRRHFSRTLATFGVKNVGMMQVFKHLFSVILLLINKAELQRSSTSEVLDQTHSQPRAPLCTFDRNIYHAAFLHCH